MREKAVRNVGILVFPEVEVLDFAAPFEVFSRTRFVPGADSRRDEASAAFRVATIGTREGAITATGGLQIMPSHTLSDCPELDVLIVPGGFGTRPLLEHASLLSWIQRIAGRVELTAAVCTGSLLLARAGLLRGRRATTHWCAFERLAQEDPTCEVDRAARVVDDGVITSAGVSAGLDMAFYVVEKFCGAAVADDTARYIEYHRQSTDKR